MQCYLRDIKALEAHIGLNFNTAKAVLATTSTTSITIESQGHKLSHVQCEIRFFPLHFVQHDRTTKGGKKGPHPIDDEGVQNMQSSLESQQALYSIPQLLIQSEHHSRIMMTRTRKTVILADVTFTVPDGSLFAINGPSCSGNQWAYSWTPVDTDAPSADRPSVAGFRCSRPAAPRYP
jgi:hypothetical protein